jgi:hypothetical protein
VAIGTINLRSLCIKYLYSRHQIQYNLSGKPITIIGNSSNKEEEFSLIKINVTSIHLFPYVKDKVATDSTLTHGDEFLKELLSSTDWVDFTDPIVDTLYPTSSLLILGNN